jgi:hypothetical protein
VNISLVQIELIPSHQKIRPLEATTHISTKSSNETCSWHEGGGAVRQQWLDFPTSCILEGGGAVRRCLGLPTSWREGGGAVRLEREANLP